jgi:alpha-beta hydrolase superfamily lysophospholipase
MVFNAKPLPQGFVFEFLNPFQEVFIPVNDEVIINGLLFKANNSKGLVFYLHGNAGKLDTWGTIADFYIENGYDFFIIDYRNFGKSTGVINKEKDMYIDLQVVYDSVQNQYNYIEKDIILIGYSIGTGFAAKLAADNNPKQLILKAPYYSIPNLVNQSFKVIPHLLFKFKLPTYKYIKQVKAPITVFHGDKDKVIPIKSSFKLSKFFKANDTLIVMPNQNHSGINANKVYTNEMNIILN